MNENKTHLERLQAANVSISRIFWLDAIAAVGAPSALQDVLNGELPDRSRQIRSKIPQLVPYLDRYDGCDLGDAEAIMTDVGGFFAEIESPIPLDIFDDEYLSHEDHKRVEWVHADSLEDLVRIAEGIGAEVRERFENVAIATKRYLDMELAGSVVEFEGARWTTHDGGVCPVPAQRVVKVSYLTGHMICAPAGLLNWGQRLKWKLWQE